MSFTISVIIIIVLLILIFLNLFIGKSNYKKILGIKIYKNSGNAKLIVVGIISGVIGAGLMGYNIPEFVVIFMIVAIIFLMFTFSKK